jgi:ATP-dependent RNA/DNA helicase IGHMBP2
LHAHESVHFSDLHHFNPAFTEGLAVEFIDTAGCGYTEQSFSETSSVANPEEADLLLKHLQQLLEQFPKEEVNPEKGTQNGTENSLKIGIISPYRAQINYLKDQVEVIPELHQLSVKKQLSVGTVDSFQGQERDIIYISMVRSNDRGEIGFLADIRRMNVAMTRARKKLVIVGDSATLTYDPFYKEFVEYTEAIGAYRSAWELISE